MAQITKSLIIDILHGAGCTRNELEQLAYFYLKKCNQGIIMDNRIPNHPNAPDYEGVDTPTAADVANDIMNNILTEYDITTWKTLTDAEQAEAFRDIIGIIAAFKYDHDLPVLENRSTLLFEIQDYCERFLTNAAIDEGYGI